MSAVSTVSRAGSSLVEFVPWKVAVGIECEVMYAVDALHAIESPTY